MKIDLPRIYNNVLNMRVYTPSGVMMLFFTGSYCFACKQMYPVIKQLRKDGFKVEEKDVDANKKLVVKYQITSLPTFVILRGSKEVKRFVGITPLASLRDALKDLNYIVW